MKQLLNNYFCMNKEQNKVLVTLAPADIALVWILALRAPFLVTILDVGGVAFLPSPAERRGCGGGGVD